ncbi:MAG TPA: methylated-DNA--[protein]-cysteine S-methyltransferase [Mycobacteriales bacterium]|nr:methylated-DNA--[protein]-cysteine S-methyltransferase [Mycobacteriales bacterium]
MTSMPVADPLTAALAALAADAPADLGGRIFARWVRVPGPVGDVFVASTERGIAYLRPATAVGDSAERFRAEFQDRQGRPLIPASRPPAGLIPALRTGAARGLAYDLTGLSSFDRDVLAATLTIPSGQLRPYGWVAAEIGRPRAVRAVGSALGRNPVPLLIPCHRVTRSDGRPGDYLFGRSMKLSVLEAEGVDLPSLALLAAAGRRYAGSDRTGVICHPTCPHVRRITAAHRRDFPSVAAAVRAGYRPCRDCRPAPSVQRRTAQSGGSHPA